MDKLTPSQLELLKRASLYTSPKCPIKYDLLKTICEFKTFDLTFNALLNKGYFERHHTMDFSNKFKRTLKPIPLQEEIAI